MATVPGTGVILTLHGDSTGVILTFVLDDGIYAYIYTTPIVNTPPAPFPHTTAPQTTQSCRSPSVDALGRCAGSAGSAFQRADSMRGYVVIFYYTLSSSSSSSSPVTAGPAASPCLGAKLCC